MERKLSEEMCEKYQEFLIDESKYQGCAQSISFPECEEEICQILKQMKEKRIPVTIQGGKTGITGASVPNQGHILNLSRMNRILKSDLEKGTITVEPGITLMDLEKEILRVFGKQKLFWPVQPTEKSASVGGVAATGAQGPNEFFYGDSRQYFAAARMVCMDGHVEELNRDTSGDLLNAALGREGIGGVFTSLTLRLVPKPEEIWGICFFFQEEDNLAAFADVLNENCWEREGAQLTVKEYLDKKAFLLIQERKKDMAKIRELPDIDENCEGMVYLELEGMPDAVEELAEELMELAAEWDSDPDTAWALSGEMEVEKLRAFRHAAAESVNLCVEAARKQEPSLTKLGTDYKYPGKKFSNVLAYYREELVGTGIEYTIFGHLGDAHLHVNLLPKTEAEYQEGCRLFKKWAKNCQDAGGNLIGEHGIGKLKREILRDLLEEKEIQVYRDFKEKYDPEYLLNPGTIFSEEE